jgi:RNA polymerase sigma-70 factor, ECF subfamily
MDTTPPSLLERVRERSDQEAWARFVQLYTPLVFALGRKCGLQAEDAADLTQDVFATLLEQMPTFKYDQKRSFRAWLRTVTLNRWRDRRKRVATRPLPANAAAVDDIAGPNHIAALEEREYRDYLVGRALRLMQADFQQATWRAFWEHGVCGRSAAAVAAELGVTVAAVYGARFRVLSRLRRELDGLLE